jgi:hypothetical protein
MVSNLITRRALVFGSLAAAAVVVIDRNFLQAADGSSGGSP